MYQANGSPDRVHLVRNRSSSLQLAVFQPLSQPLQRGHRQLEIVLRELRPSQCPIHPSGILRRLGYQHVSRGGVNPTSSQSLKISIHTRLQRRPWILLSHYKGSTGIQGSQTPCDLPSGRRGADLRALSNLTMRIRRLCLCSNGQRFVCLKERCFQPQL